MRTQRVSCTPSWLHLPNNCRPSREPLGVSSGRTNFALAICKREGTALPTKASHFYSMLCERGAELTHLRYLFGKRKPTKRESTLVQCLWRFLGIVGWDPSVSKSNCLCVDIVWISFTTFKRWTIDLSLKWSIIFLQSWTSTGYFSNSTGSSVTSGWFSSVVALVILLTWMWAYETLSYSRTSLLQGRAECLSLVRGLWM